MKEKIILTIIDLFSSAIPIMLIILGFLSFFFLLSKNSFLLGLISLIGCLISAANSYGFGIILSAAYVYLWKDKQQQQ